MTRNLQRELDALTDAWVAANDPGADLTWPAVDAGRTRGSIPLSTVEIAADLAAMEAGETERPRPTLPDGPLCSHCGLAPVKVKHAKRFGRTVEDVCARCVEHFRRHGDLPSRKLNAAHARRMGLTWEVPLCVEVMTPTATKRTRAERHADTLVHVAAIREATVEVCRAFANQVESRNGFLSDTDSQTWDLMLVVVRSMDNCIAQLRPTAARSAEFERYADSRTPPPTPAGSYL